MFDSPPDMPVPCTVCGAPLGFSHEDQPDWPSGPLCGNCYQADQHDDEVFAELFDDE